MKRSQKGFISAPMLGIGRRQSGGDPYFASVVLLAINDNGPDGGTTFTDQSSSAKTLTANGNAQWDTAQAPTGLTSSALFDGTGDFISAADSSDWYFADGDYTFEFYLRFSTHDRQAMFLTQDNNAAGQRGWGIWRNTTTLTNYFSLDTNTITQLPSAAWSAANDVWYHIATSREGANLRVFIDGTQFSTTYNIGTSSLGDAAATLRIGSWNIGALSLAGWMAAVRITKGVARYTTTFTPPTLPLPTS